jgi:hypothetical protein
MDHCMHRPAKHAHTHAQAQPLWNHIFCAMWLLIKRDADREKHARTHLHLQTRKLIRKNTHTHIHTHACARTNTHKLKNTQTHTQTHTHTHTLHSYKPKLRHRHKSNPVAPLPFLLVRAVNPFPNYSLFLTGLVPALADPHDYTPTFQHSLTHRAAHPQ